MIESPDQLAIADRSLTRLEELYGLFGEVPPRHSPRQAVQLPEPQRSLLHHERHMTVTLERFHDVQVRLTVLQQVHRGDFYARKILLSRPDDTVVQFGLMRIDLRRVNQTARAAILEGARPLGRILIEEEILRRISMHGLLELEATGELRDLAGCRESESLYGRLATILCNESPAVDLLEVVCNCAPP